MGCIVVIIILVFFVPHGSPDLIDNTLSDFNKPTNTPSTSKTTASSIPINNTGTTTPSNTTNPSPILKIDVTPVAAPSQVQSPYNNTTYSTTSTEVATHVAETSQNATLSEANAGFSPNIIIIVPRVLTTTLTLTNTSDYKFFTCSGLAINAPLQKGVNTISIDTNPGVSGDYTCSSGPNNDISMEIIEE